MLYVALHLLLPRRLPSIPPSCPSLLIDLTRLRVMHTRTDTSASASHIAFATRVYDDMMARGGKSDAVVAEAMIAIQAQVSVVHHAAVCMALCMCKWM